MRRPPDSEPSEQLLLVHEELIRQRATAADRHRTMYQRGTLLIGGSTLASGVRSARLPAAFTRLFSINAAATDPVRTTLAMLSVGVALVATISGLPAAIQGLRMFSVETGLEIDIQKFATNTLDLRPSAYSVRWSLVRDSLISHAGDVARLEARRRLFSSGSMLLVVSWFSAIVQFGVSSR